MGVAVIQIAGTGHRFDVCVVGGDGGADLGKGRSLGINVAFRHVIGSVRLPHTVAGDVGDVRRGFGVADVAGVAEPFGGEGEALVLENHLEVTFLHQRAEVHAGDRLFRGLAAGGNRVGKIQGVVFQLGQHGLGIVVGAEPFDGKAHIQIVMGSAVIGKADGLVEFDFQIHHIAGFQNLVVNAGYRIDGRRVVVHIGDDRLGQRRVARALAAFIAAVVIGALQADGKVYIGRNFVAIVSDRAVASGKAFRVFCHVPAVDEEGGIVPSAPNPVSIGQHDSRGNIGRIVFQIKQSRLPGMLMLVIVKGSRDGGLQVAALHPQLADVHVIHIDLRACIDQIVFKGQVEQAAFGGRVELAVCADFPVIQLFVDAGLCVINGHLRLEARICHISCRQDGDRHRRQEQNQLYNRKQRRQNPLGPYSSSFSHRVPHHHTLLFMLFCSSHVRTRRSKCSKTVCKSGRSRSRSVPRPRSSLRRRRRHPQASA